MNNSSISSTYGGPCKDLGGDNVFEFWSNGVFLNLIATLGIIGNVFSVIVLSRPQMRTRVNYSLISLACCDTVLIVMSILLFGIPAIYPFTGYLRYYVFCILPKISQIGYFVASSAEVGSVSAGIFNEWYFELITYDSFLNFHQVYLTLTITIERYVAVCHPLRARTICTYGRVRFFVLISIVFSICFNIPRLFEFKLKSYDDAEFGTIYCIEETLLRQSGQYKLIYVNHLHFVFLFFIPFIVIALLNLMIYRQVRVANQKRQKLTQTEKQEIGLAVMLFLIVIVFFCCNILALIANFLESFFGILNDRLINTSNLLITTNSSVNFIIYFACGRKFRRLFYVMFCNQKANRESQKVFDTDISTLSSGIQTIKIKEYR